MLIRIDVGWGNEEKPCEAAIQKSYAKIDERIVDDPRKIDHYGNKSDWWYEEGTNHRIVNGRIQRDMEEIVGWFMETESLKEVAQLMLLYNWKLESDYEPGFRGKLRLTTAEY